MGVSCGRKFGCKLKFFQLAVSYSLRSKRDNLGEDLTSSKTTNLDIRLSFGEGGGTEGVDSPEIFPFFSLKEKKTEIYSHCMGVTMGLFGWLVQPLYAAVTTAAIDAAVTTAAIDSTYCL